jgi:hypothetical protein
MASGANANPAGAGVGEVQYNVGGFFAASENLLYTESAGAVNLSAGYVTLFAPKIGVLGNTGIVFAAPFGGGYGGATITAASQSLTLAAQYNGQAGIMAFNIVDGLGHTGGWYIGGAVNGAAYGRFNFLTDTDGATIALHEGGSNSMSGCVQLVGGTATVLNGSVISLSFPTQTSRIQLTSQHDGGTPGFLRVSAINNGVGFTITSSSPLDTSYVAYLITQPAL